MIKQLRARFTLVLTALLSLVLLGVLGAVFISMCRSEERNGDRIISMAMELDYSGRWASPPKLKSEDRENRQRPPHIPDNETERFSAGWITVRLDEDNSIKSVFYSRQRLFDTDGTDTDISVESAVSQIISKGTEDKGKVSAEGVSYRYEMRNTPEGRIIVLLDRTDERSTLNRLLFILTGIFLLSSAVIFLLSLLLSKWAVIPIEDAWNRQRVFFSNASHELKTPLTVINANLDVITASPENTVSEQQKWFGYIRSETDKMSRLINEMLYLSREEQTDSSGVMTAVPLSEIAEGACLAMEAVAFEKGKNISQSIESGIDVTGDKESLSRLITILIDNAVIHSSEGSEISVCLARERKNRAKLTVSNSGKPIPSEELERIFDRYYRTDSSRSSATGGFGLGLAIAAAIARKHSGKIYAESDEQRTCFNVILKTE